MITAKEALERANNNNSIIKWKAKITEEILDACNNRGLLSVSIEIDETFNKSVEKFIAEWLEEFGYRAGIEEFVDAPSGWTLKTLVISWEEAEHGNN